MDEPSHEPNGRYYSEVEISKGLDDGDQYDVNTEGYVDGYSEEDYLEYEEQEVPFEAKGVPGEDEEESFYRMTDSASEDNEGEDKIVINGLTDILNIEMKKISVAEAERFDFINLEVAYQFYCWFGRMNGFFVRKGQVLRGNGGVIVQQTFLCSRQGYREDRGLTPETRMRQPKHETRCGCRAHFRVHIDTNTQRWYVSVFNFDHNHALLEDIYCSLLPTRETYRYIHARHGDIPT